MTYKTCIKGQICVWNWCTFKFKVNLKDEFDRVSTPLGQKKKICLFPDRPGFESTDLHSNWRPKFFSSVKIRKYWIKTISASLSFCIEMLKQLPLVAKAIPFLCFLNWGRPKLIGKKKKKNTNLPTWIFLLWKQETDIYFCLPYIQFVKIHAYLIYLLDLVFIYLSDIASSSSVNVNLWVK